MCSHKLPWYSYKLSQVSPSSWNSADGRPGGPRAQRAPHKKVLRFRRERFRWARVRRPKLVAQQRLPLWQAARAARTAMPPRSKLRRGGGPQRGAPRALWNKQIWVKRAMVSNAWNWYFVELLSRLVRQLNNIVPHISWHAFPCHKTTKRYADFPSMVIFSCSCRNSGFKQGSVIVNNIFAYFTLSLSTPQVYMIKERCWFSQINFFVEYCPHRIDILFLYR